MEETERQYTVPPGFAVVVITDQKSILGARYRVEFFYNKVRAEGYHLKQRFLDVENYLYELEWGDGLNLAKHASLDIKGQRQHVVWSPSNGGTIHVEG